MGWFQSSMLFTFSICMSFIYLQEHDTTLEDLKENHRKEKEDLIAEHQKALEEKVSDLFAKYKVGTQTGCFLF